MKEYETNIKEICEGLPVRITECDNELYVEALNESGCNSTLVNLIDIIEWVKINKPELIK